MTPERKQFLLDTLIDDRCDLLGVRNTIAYFIDIGLDKEDLLELGFDEADIEIVMSPDYDADLDDDLEEPDPEA